MKKPVSVSLGSFWRWFLQLVQRKNRPVLKKSLRLYLKHLCRKQKKCDLSPPGRFMYSKNSKTTAGVLLVWGFPLIQMNVSQQWSFSLMWCVVSVCVAVLVCVHVWGLPLCSRTPGARFVTLWAALTQQRQASGFQIHVSIAWLQLDQVSVSYGLGSSCCVQGRVSILKRTQKDQLFEWLWCLCNLSQVATCGTADLALPSWLLFDATLWTGTFFRLVWWISQHFFRHWPQKPGLNLTFEEAAFLSISAVLTS